MVKKKKTVHIQEDLHKAVELYKIEEGIESIEKAVDRLIRAGFELKEEELPEYIFTNLQSDKEVKSDFDKNIELSDLSKNIIDLSKKLEGGKVASDQSIREITLGCLRYLKNNDVATHKDFKDNVYPLFEEDHKESSFWKVAKEGLHQIEELGDIVETPRGRGHYKYKWKL